MKILNNFLSFFQNGTKSQKNWVTSKESLDQDLSFGFCFIKIEQLESTFWGGALLLGDGGGLRPNDDAHALSAFQ